MDPYDIEVGRLDTESVGRPFLRGQRALPVEAEPYVDDPISNYEDRHGVPYTAIKLGYGDIYKTTPDVEMRVRAVDEFIRATMQQERVRDSRVGYDTIFNRLAQKFGEPVESAVNHGTASKILDNLFMQASFANKMSSKTYFKDFTKRFAQERTAKLLSHLKETLKALK